MDNQFNDRFRYILTSIISKISGRPLRQARLVACKVLVGKTFLEGLGVSGRITVKMDRNEIRLERANRICLASNLKQAANSCVGWAAKLRVP